MTETTTPATITVRAHELRPGDRIAYVGTVAAVEAIEATDAAGRPYPVVIATIEGSVDVWRRHADSPAVIVRPTSALDRIRASLSTITDPSRRVALVVDEDGSFLTVPLPTDESQHETEAYAAALSWAVARGYFDLTVDDAPTVEYFPPFGDDDEEPYPADTYPADGREAIEVCTDCYHASMGYGCEGHDCEEDGCELLSLLPDDVSDLSALSYLPDGRAIFDMSGEHPVEPHFSWQSCDGCGTTLGGDRYDVIPS